MRAPVLEEPMVQATFLPSDPPRFSRIGFWSEVADEARSAALPSGPSGGTIEEIDLLEFEDGRFLIRQIPMEVVPILDAMESLLAANPATLSPSAASLRSAGRHALLVMARAEVQPSLTNTGIDAWKLGPLKSTDIDHFEAIARSMPAEAWAVRGSTSASQSVDELSSAVADAFVRTPGAPIAAGHRAFASMSPSVVDVRSAVSSFEMATEQRSPLLVLRLMPPPPGAVDDEFVAALGLQSRGEAARILDMESLWRAPQALRERFASIETTLLITLRRAARVWPPAQRLLAQQTPDRITLSDDEVDELLGSVGRDLGSVGLSVLVAGELLRSVDLTPVVRSAPRIAGATRFDLSSVMQLDWRAAIDGQQLSEEELIELAEAKRPLIRFRGEWVRVDGRGVRRLREQRTIGASTALAVALGALVEIDGSELMTVEGPLAEIADRLRSLDANQEVEPPATLHGELRPYQRRGLAWLALMADLGLGGVLADDMGLGKTIQILALHLHRSHLYLAAPMLVVCPASVVGNWEREIKRFAPSLRVHRYHGQNRKLGTIAPTDVVLTTYGVARRDATDLGAVPWGLVVADEAQAIKNPYSRTAKAMRRIPAGARFALTGTPVQNHLVDLWAILDWSTPGLLGPLERFRRDLAAPVEQGDNPEATEQLSRLLRPFVLRRTKADPTIVPDLPPKTETDEIVPLTTEQVALYQAVVTEVMSEIAGAEGIERKGLVLRLITRLKQVCNHPEHLLAEGGPLAGRSGKLRAVTELIDTIQGEGQAALVFTQYVKMAELLQQHFEAQGFRTLFLHGGMTLSKRQEMVDKFQAGEADVFLLSLRAGGTGLNLTQATHVIHYDRWWNPAVEDQASDRAWRIGQTKPVQIHRMICEGTIEDRIASLLNDKRKLAEAVIGAGEGWISDLSDDDLAELVSLSDPDGTDLERAG